MLLILAVVAVNIAIDADGLFSKTKVAAEETRGANVEEQKELWRIEKEADNYSGTKMAQTIEELLETMMNKKLITEEEKNEIKTTGKVTIGNRTICFLDYVINSYPVTDGGKLKQGLEQYSSVIR